MRIEGDGDGGQIRDLQRQTWRVPIPHASNGEVVASSEGYKTKASAENGIKSVQTNAPGATVVDNTG
ncbi:YegP family protein [Mycobacterium sp.]|uniref:YegP family protein n=1 Tax=Mycobacterium sp. TaxID=1785 RepID=UPI003F7E1091